MIFGFLFESSGSGAVLVWKKKESKPLPKIHQNTKIRSRLKLDINQYSERA